MTQAELDLLVAQIGKELLEQLGRIRPSPDPAAVSAPVAHEAIADCGCAASCAADCLGEARALVEAGAARVSACPVHPPAEASIAALIDHTLLKADATADDIRKLCEEARCHGFASVCVNPYWVPPAAALLKNSGVKVCAVAGFPLGASCTAVKVLEAESAIRCGAVEVDMVMNVGALRSGDNSRVLADIRAVTGACHRGGAIVKVILENAYLSDDQKALACRLCVEAGADFVKTSTGFGPSGATVEDVALMRSVTGPGMGIKAAGGIRTIEDLRRMKEAGATRIGASASVRILAAAQAGAGDSSAGPRG